MPTPNQLSTALTLDQPGIVRSFNDATARPPWNRLPEEERINFLRHLIEPLARLALRGPDDQRLCARALRIAARHGKRRRDQGLSEEALLQDFDLFGEAILRQLADLEADLPLLEASARVEQILTFASLASLRGYHRDDFEARGRWPKAVDELSHRLRLDLS